MGKTGQDVQLDKSLAAAQVGLICVNLQGPDGMPSTLAAARDIREAFKRMASHRNHPGKPLSRCRGQAGLSIRQPA
ncbi:MAG: hypothetical protein ACK5Q5_00880 [Planctomycetaceae bacterium]